MDLTLTLTRDTHHCHTELIYLIVSHTATQFSVMIIQIVKMEDNSYFKIHIISILYILNEREKLTISVAAAWVFIVGLSIYK